VLAAQRQTFRLLFARGLPELAEPFEVVLATEDAVDLGQDSF